MATPIVNDRQFGILIAYVIPGFLVVSGLSLHLPAVASWMGPENRPTVGGFLYATIASIACGLVNSTVRWLIVDTVLHLTGVPKARWDLSMLREQLPAFETFVLYTYRYYQFYGNSVVAIPIWAILCWSSCQTISIPRMSALAVIELVLLAGARDTLKKYYERTNVILGPASTTRIVIP